MALTATYWDRTVDRRADRPPVCILGRLPEPAALQHRRDEGARLRARPERHGVRNDRGQSLELFANGAYLQQTVTDMGDAPPLKPGYYRYGNWVREGYAPGLVLRSQAGRRAVPAGYVDGDGQPDTLRAAARVLLAAAARVETIRTVLQPGIDGDPLLNYLGKPTPDWAGAFGGSLSFLQNFRVVHTVRVQGGLPGAQPDGRVPALPRPAIGRNIRASAELEAILLNPGQLGGSAGRGRAASGRLRCPRSPRRTGLNAIEDGDFVRWRELSLSYRVPAWTDRSSASACAAWS